MHFSPEVGTALKNYSWPGNVRELQNVIQNLTITRDHSLIVPSDLPRHILGISSKSQSSAAAQPPRPLKEIVAALERDILENAVQAHGSINKIAELYQVDRTTIFRKLRRDMRTTP
jgi:transcriptional regulator with PAS, ATPase and Fis domain